MIHVELLKSQQFNIVSLSLRRREAFKKRNVLESFKDYG